MRTIEVTAKTLDQAIEKGLQMLGLKREEVEINVISAGSMLKKAAIEMTTFLSDEERTKFLEEQKSKPKKITQEKVKLVKKSNESTKPEVIREAVNLEDCENEIIVAKEFILGLTELFGLTANLEVAVVNGEACVKVTGENMGTFIGFHGENMEAVQFMINTIIKNKFPEFRRRIYIDVENYKAKRQNNLEELATRMAKKVIANKKSMKLEPMNSYDRKSIHSALQDIEHIGTHSEGEEPHRYLVIDYID